MARYSAGIKFQCPICKHNVTDEIPVPVTYWSGEGADDRMVIDEAGTQCHACNTEYDLHIKNINGQVWVKIHGYERTSVEAGQAEMMEPDYDEWDIPSDPAIMIQMTLEDVRIVLRETPSSLLSDTLLRMAFIQQFAVLEAYLSDTLITEVLNKPGALARVIEGDDDLRKMKLPLAMIHNNPGIVPHTVAIHLRDLVYHNFGKVGSIWREALDFDLFPNDDVKERMMKAGPIRHDCVHRNGVGKDGNVRTEVNDGFVEQIDKDIRAMVGYIEDQLPRVT